MTTGCAALRERALGFAKDQGFKILVNQIDKLEKKFDLKVAEAGGDVEKLKEQAAYMISAIKGGLPEGETVFTTLHQAINSTKDKQGNIQWILVLSYFGYVLKQGLWGKIRRTENDKIIAKVNGIVNGGGNSGSGRQNPS